MQSKRTFVKELNWMKISTQPNAERSGLTVKANPDISESANRALTQWITAKPWTFFVTFTTRYTSSEKQMRRLMERTHEKWLNLSPEYVNTFWVMEKHKHRGYHIHGLVDWSGQCAKNTTKEELQASWKNCVDAYQVAAGKVRSEEQFDGWHRNRIELLEQYKSKSAAEYCAKYLTKDKQDWDYFTGISRNA